MMIAASTRSKPASGIRRANLQQDLSAIADLIEVCFSARMDASGRATIREMRALARLGPLLNLMALSDDMLKGIGLGYVWEEGGQIVGNATIFPARYPSGMAPAYVIANVAVHPDYRRRGIARHMMAASLESIQAGGGQAAILQVESENVSARQLYEDLGFHTQRAWHEWRRSGQLSPPHKLITGPRITNRAGADWQAEMVMAERVFPQRRGGLGWQRPLHQREFHRPFNQQLLGFLSGMAIERWTAREDDRLAGSLWAKTRLGSPIQLTLIVGPDGQGRLEEPLLNYGLRRLSAGYRSLFCAHPADHLAATALFERYRFSKRRTLDHMLLAL